MIALGIDPGLSLTGYACVRILEGIDSRPDLLEAGVFTFDRRQPAGLRLSELRADLEALIDRCRPDCACVESLFAHYSHPRTAIIMAHARGVILASIAAARLPLVEVSPATVKRAIAGHGRASKEQMQSAVAALFGLGSTPDPPDVADAIALAISGSRRYDPEPRLASRARRL